MAKWIKKSYDEEKMEEKVLMPYTYLLPLRIYGFVSSKLPKAFNYWLNIPNDKLKALQQIFVKINNALAIQDDLMDESLYRRTRPAAHRVFGKALAFNSCIHLQFIALQDIIQLGHPKGAEVYCKNYINFARGQGLSTYWRDHQHDVTVDEYTQTTINQTGCIILMIVQMMQLFSENKTDYEYLAKIFSIYYQIRDEYVDLKKPEAVEEGTRIPELQKLSTMTFCDDFTEGKYTLPVIYALKSSQHRDIILGILKMRTRDLKTKEYLLSLLEETGGIEKTRETLREIEADILAEIRRLGGNPVFEDLMRDLHSWDEQP